MPAAPGPGAAATAASRFNARRLFADYAILWVVLALFVFLALTTPKFLTEPNLRNIMDQQSLVLIAASVATLTMIAGGFDVSQGAVYVAAPLLALYVENQTGNVLLGALAGLGFGLVVGIVNGTIVTVARINSFIATLAVSFIIFGIGYIVSDGAILRPVTKEWQTLARTNILGITSATWAAIIVIALSWFALARTRYGRYVYAVGGNVEAARLTGVRVRWIVASVFVLAALAAALAGVLRSSRSISATPSDDLSFVFAVIAAIVVGGTSIAGGEGTVWRTVLGAFFIGLMNNGFNLNGVDPIYQRIVQGLVILGAVGIDAWSRSRRS
ncbi:MAG: ABC transporter permease [Chloroflexota bacterium]